MATMDRDQYCIQVCKGKCCIFRDKTEGEVRCPNLQENGACGVYKERYADGMPDVVAVGRYRSKVYKDLKGEFVDRPFFCGRIEQILAAGSLPRDIRDQCCYFNPAVLERVEDQ